MATKNAIDNKSQELTVDPGASGDSFVQFDINGTGEFRIGVDDDASDAFKISQGSALGTTDTFVMAAAGERTMPLQPAFLATLETQDTDVTGDATNFELGIDGNALTEVFDRGSDFSGGTFTAPITGKYLLHTALLMSDVAAAHTAGILTIKTSNSSYILAYCDPGQEAASNDFLTLTAAVFCDMDASDTAFVSITIANSTKTVDLLTNNRDTRFAGFLVC